MSLCSLIWPAYPQRNYRVVPCAQFCTQARKVDSLLLCWHAEVLDGVVCKVKLLPLIVCVIRRSGSLVLQQQNRQTQVI